MQAVTLKDKYTADRGQTLGLKIYSTSNHVATLTYGLRVALPVIARIMDGSEKTREWIAPSER